MKKTQELLIRHAEKEYTLRVQEEEAGFYVELWGKRVWVTCDYPAPHLMSLLIEGKSYLFQLKTEEEGCISLMHQGHKTHLQVRTALDKRLAEMGLKNSKSLAHQQLKAPMPGKIVRLFVQPGERVEKGQALLVMEAMKMQNEMKATASAVVGKIFVSEGQAVEACTALMDFAAA